MTRIADAEVPFDRPARPGTAALRAVPAAAAGWLAAAVGGVPGGSTLMRAADWLAAHPAGEIGRDGASHVARIGGRPFPADDAGNGPGLPSWSLEVLVSRLDRAEAGGLCPLHPPVPS